MVSFKLSRCGILIVSTRVSNMQIAVHPAWSGLPWEPEAGGGLEEAVGKKLQICGEVAQFRKRHTVIVGRNSRGKTPVHRVVARLDVWTINAVGWFAPG